MARALVSVEMVNPAQVPGGSVAAVNVEVVTDTGKVVDRQLSFSAAQVAGATAASFLASIKNAVISAYQQSEGVTISSSDVLVFGAPQ